MLLSRKWLVFALVTTLSWGVWGALSGLFANASVPSTIVYSIWAVTMIPPCIFVLKTAKWRLAYDKQAVILGCLIGFLGSGGQMLLFYALTVGPAYLIFPLISLSPIVTIALSIGLLKERTGLIGWLGIVLALISLPLFEYSPAGEPREYGSLWFILAVLVMAAWGLQAYFMKFANAVMSAESIFFYMAVTGLALIPVALLMTDFGLPIDFSAPTVITTAGIQILNAIGALCLVFAFRYGKAIVVSPLTNAGAPLISAVIAIVVLSVLPSGTKSLAIVLAIVAAVLLAIEPEERPVEIVAN